MSSRPAPAPSTLVQRLINDAAQLDLNPTIGDIYRGSVRVMLNGTGEWSGFGALIVGARSGKLIRASLTFGTDGGTLRAETMSDARRLFNAYAGYRAEQLGWI